MNKITSLFFIGMMLTSCGHSTITDQKNQNISITRPNETIRINNEIEDNFNKLKSNIEINTLSTDEDREILYDLFGEYPVEVLISDIKRFYVNYSAKLKQGFYPLSEYYKTDFNIEPFNNDYLLNKISTVENDLMSFIKVFGDDFDLKKPSDFDNTWSKEDYEAIFNKQDDFRRKFSNKFKLYFYNEANSKDFVNINTENNLSLLTRLSPLNENDVDNTNFKVSQLSIIKEYNNDFYLLTKTDFGTPYKLLKFHSIEDIKLYAKYFSDETQSLFIDGNSFQIARNKIK